MELYHLLLLVWILFVTLWTLKEVQAADRRRRSKKK
jgi:hypothetical protein